MKRIFKRSKNHQEPNRLPRGNCTHGAGDQVQLHWQGAGPTNDASETAPPPYPKGRGLATLNTFGARAPSYSEDPDPANRTSEACFPPYPESLGTANHNSGTAPPPYQKGPDLATFRASGARARARPRPTDPDPVNHTYEAGIVLHPEVPSPANHSGASAQPHPEVPGTGFQADHTPGTGTLLYPESRVEPPNQPLIVIKPITSLGYNKVKVVCPYCKSDISTRTTIDVPCFVRLLCVACCLFSCCLSCIPYMIMYRVRHDCPYCGCYIGTSSRR